MEDDAAPASELKNHMESYGNSVTVVENFRQVVEEFAKVQPQLVLMDIMLPFKDGYYWTAEIRRISTVPIVFLSSAADNMNIIMAIHMGGDDFISKPVDPMVLNAKVQAVLRRTYEIQDQANVLAFGAGARLNLSDGSISVDGEKIELTKNEFRILRTLLENRGKIVSRETLMVSLWNDDCYVEENTLTVNVTRLRRKLESCGLKDVIRTKPGSGYIVDRG